MLRFLFLVLCLLLTLSCSPKQKEEPVSKIPKTSLRLFALENIRSSGFEGVVLKEFGKKHNCAMELVIFPDLPSLLDALQLPENQGRVDLALSIDNAFASSDTLLAPFQPATAAKLEHLNRDLRLDEQQRIIPYAYSNLAIIYNADVYPEAPNSFGELQDARFYSQLALCDPGLNGLGRATLLWSLALFGDAGYQQLWLSLRKNIHKVYPNPDAAWEALKKGECNLLLGHISTPAWSEELNQSEKSFKFVIPREGSYQYVESVALVKDAPNPEVAVEFIEFLLLPDTQRQVMYKLGLLPVNSRTPLALRFASLPLSVYSMNDRLTDEEIAFGMPSWLDFWNRLFIPGLGF